MSGTFLGVKIYPVTKQSSSFHGAYSPMKEDKVRHQQVNIYSDMENK